jgi:hypothetical protein
MSDSTFSLPPAFLLVNGFFGTIDRNLTLVRSSLGEAFVIVFRSLFPKRKGQLTGAPPVRRMKTYSAQSGYVYQYFYEGHRSYTGTGDNGMEYVFSISPDRKNWHACSVFLSNAAVNDWEKDRERRLTSTERYAVAKLALFQAFDDRVSPAHMHEAVRVRRADLDAIVDTLGL